MAADLRRGDRQISETRFQRREDFVLAFSRILSGGPAGQNVPRDVARVRTNPARRSVECGGSVQEEMSCRGARRGERCLNGSVVGLVRESFSVAKIRGRA